MTREGSGQGLTKLVAWKHNQRVLGSVKIHPAEAATDGEEPVREILLVGSQL